MEQIAIAILGVTAIWLSQSDSSERRRHAGEEVMYTLILTIAMYAGNYNYSAASSSIESVPGFVTKAQCLAAANEWLKQNRAHASQVIRTEFRALCVEARG